MDFIIGDALTRRKLRRRAAKGKLSVLTTEKFFPYSEPTVDDARDLASHVLNGAPIPTVKIDGETKPAIIATCAERGAGCLLVIRVYVSIEEEEPPIPNTKTGDFSDDNFIG